MTALWVARPLFPSESAATHGDGLTAVMLWIALLVFWFLGSIGRPKLAVRFGCTDAAVALLMLCFTAAALWAVGHGSPRPAVNVLWEWLGMGLSFFLARQLIATPREARAVAAVMVALAVAVSAFGIYQWAYELPATLAKYDANPDGELRRAGLWFPPDSPERKLFRDRLASDLPAGTFALSNSLAGFVAPWLVVLAGVAWSSLRNRKRLAMTIACMAPLAVCLLLTRSRSGCIAAGVGVLLVWLLRRQRRFRPGWRTAVVAAVLLAAAVAVGTLHREKLAQATKSFGYRVQYWQSSLQMIADHPWLGCGPGNFQDAYTRYKLPEASEEIADPHNFLLEIWATAGTPAALAFLAVLGCFAWSQYKSGDLGFSNQPSPNPKSQIPNPKSDPWPHVLAGGGIGFLLSVPLGMLSAAPPGTTAVPLGPFGHVNVATAVLLGLPLAAATVAVLLGWIREGRMPGWLPAVAVVVLLVDLLAAGGIGLPGVAGTFWLLLCLGLQGHGLRTCRGWGAWAGLAAAIALAVACFNTAYSPVLSCQARMRVSERMTDRAVEQLKAAAAADPLSAEPWRQLAAAWFDGWWRTPSQALFEQFERADANVLRLAPNSAPDWLASGDWYLAAALKTDRQGKKLVPGALGKAVEAYQKAVELYPNSAVHRARLGEAYRAAGEPAAFRREAEAALRLDHLTPHPDKKLPADVRNRLLHGLRGGS